MAIALSCAATRADMLSGVNSISSSSGRPWAVSMRSSLSAPRQPAIFSPDGGGVNGSGDCRVSMVACWGGVVAVCSATSSIDLKYCNCSISCWPKAIGLRGLP